MGRQTPRMLSPLHRHTQVSTARSTPANIHLTKASCTAEPKVREQRISLSHRGAKAGHTIGPSVDEAEKTPHSWRWEQGVTIREQ